MHYLEEGYLSLEGALLLEISYDLVRCDCFLKDICGVAVLSWHREHGGELATYVRAFHPSLRFQSIEELAVPAGEGIALPDTSILGPV